MTERRDPLEDDEPTLPERNKAERDARVQQIIDGIRERLRNPNA